MKKLLSVFLICACLSVYSQNEFADIKEEVHTWYSSVKLVSTISTKPPKSIDFTTHNYSIKGVIAKGLLCEGTIVQFYETVSHVPNLLLEGRVSYQTGRLVVKGIRYIKTLAGTNKIYGTFYVYNMDDLTMNYKPKKAGALRIKRSKVSYLEGFYLECPVIVRMNENSSVYVDGKTGGRGYSFLSAVIPSITLNDDDSFDIYQSLLQAKDDVTMCWENGIKFKGRVKPTPREDGAIVFYTLDGQKTGMTTGPLKITISHQNGYIICSLDYGYDNQLLLNESLLVRDNGTILEDDYWNLEKIYELCCRAKWTYKNGNYFEGIIKTVITPNKDTNTSTISKTATKGVFKYFNGDRFEGDVSSKSVGPFFVDGTTFFADGSKVKGNWLEKFELNNNQWEKVYKCQNPSDAKALAEKLMHSNYYPEYEYSERIEFFDPSAEKLERTWGRYVIYDKAMKHYTCIYRDSKKTQLEFAVDNKGCRKWEIVFKNGKPTYFNEFTWYSNGVVESIKSYSYNTKKIYLSCNFFSDGKLRSAYQYGRGNTGENILRKSKESHPIFGGYTCKLYDLNGNYERSIDWEIGIGESLFGGRYDQKMAPANLVFGELKPIE